MPFALKLAAVLIEAEVVALAAVLNSSITAALIGGVFLVINAFITAWLQTRWQRHEEHEHAIRQGLDEGAATPPNTHGTNRDRGNRANGDPPRRHK